MKAQQGRSAGIVRIGLFNLLLRLLISPLAFVFSLLIAKYLSSVSIETFGAWQSIYVLITGYFLVPADVLSTIASRYAAEGKKIGGIIVINALAGAIVLSVYFMIVPFISGFGGSEYEVYFYDAGILLFLYYVLDIAKAVSLGRSPRVSAIGNAAFQLVRLIAAVVFIYEFNLSILAVILAYSLGYLSQILTYVKFTKADFSVDLKVAIASIRKSVVFITSYIQGVIEASMVWISVYLLRSYDPVSYFESALIISNIVIWSSSASDGLFLKLAESKDPKVLETALKLFFAAGSLFLLLAMVDGLPLLYILRSDYISAFTSLIILSVSNFVRSIYGIFYRAIYMADVTLNVENTEELRGPTARLIRSNVLISAIGVALSSGIIYFLSKSSLSPGYGYPIVATVISVGLLVNSLGMVITSFLTAKKLYNFDFPVKETVIPLLATAVVSSLFLMWFSIHGVPKLRTLEEIKDTLLISLAAGSIYLAINWTLNPYVKELAKRAIMRIKNL
ncbi:MAG: teichoic acid transporter [Candidatus Aramenus sp.]|nr:teichoic acid transporter [Candidatus Aramenus sp.]